MAGALVIVGTMIGLAAGQVNKDSSYLPVVPREDFAATMSRMKAAKAVGDAAAARRCWRSGTTSRDRRAGDVTMARGKPIQEGIRVKLPGGATWEQLGAMTPEEIKAKEPVPGGLPAAAPRQPRRGGHGLPEGPHRRDAKQEGRDLTRFDLDFDLPDHFMPEFPPPIFLTTRLDLGDVSKGQLVTLDNFLELFNGILNPKQLDGIRLLVTPFAQQQFNATEDRRSERPSRGVACFDCHVNGHTNGGFHLAGDVRPQPHRRRIETPSLRGVNIQRLFGSQRALKSVEDFTEFEQRAAYFDGDPVTATKKGVNPLDRGSQVQFMAEMQELFDFPPAPKLGIDGRLDPAKASEAELRGEALFFGKAKCATCHQPPFYTDNLMHNLRTERFFAPGRSTGAGRPWTGPSRRSRCAGSRTPRRTSTTVAS